MVWSNIPGANIHRAAEADNTGQRTEQAGVKRSTYPSVYSVSVQAQAPSRDSHRSHKSVALNCDPAYVTDQSSVLLKSKTVGDNTIVRFNNHYCPELGAAMALARQEVFGSHPSPGSSDLISSRPCNKVFETFTDSLLANHPCLPLCCNKGPTHHPTYLENQALMVPRLVDTLSLLRRHAPSAPLHHYPHGFGSLRTVRPNMSSPAPGWICYADNKAAGMTECPESPSAPAPRAVTRCPVAHPHQRSQAVHTQSVPAASMPPQHQGAWREQDSHPVRVPAGSCLDSSAMLQLLHQQQQADDLQAQGSAKQADMVSVGCQTRQGDNWRVQSQGCIGTPKQDAGHWAYHDKAWVPTGTHFLDKQAHEALAPKRPPNSPQGNRCPSPAARHQQHEGRAAANSPSRPAWDSSPSRAVRAAGRSPEPSPSRAQLKKMTASWSPGRKGFVKPDLAQSSDNRFSESNKHADMRGKHPSKLRKKRFPSKARTPHAPARSGQEAPKPAKTSSGARIRERNPAVPTSFLQPILHSQASNMVPDSNDSQDHTQQSPMSTKKKTKKKKPSSGGKQQARMHRQQSVADESMSDSERHAQNSPPQVITLGQSPRGSYVSPLKSSSGRALSSQRDSPLLVLQSPRRASSAPVRSPDSSLAAASSQLRPRASAGSFSSARSSELSMQDSDVVDCSCSEASSELGSGLSDDLGSERGKVQNWDSRAESPAKKGAGRKLFSDHGTAGSRASSGLRREVQDSLGELERLIEQQHRQLIARGILLPEEPSSGSVSASDLDFSNLSLYSGMDRLSRLADSLVEGVSSGNPPAQDAEPTSSISAVSRHVPPGRSASAAHTAPSPRQTVATGGPSRLRGDSWSSQGVALNPGAFLQQTCSSTMHTQGAESESVAESAQLQSHTDSQMHLHQDPQASQLDSDTRTHRQTSQTLAPQAASFRPVADITMSVHPSDAVGRSPADTESLCQYSLPSNQWRCSRSQHSSAAESTLSKHTSRGSIGHSAENSDAGSAQKAGAVGSDREARLSQHAPSATASDDQGIAAQLSLSVERGSSDRDVGLSEAEASLAEAQQTESCHSRGGDDAELANCGDVPGCGGDVGEEGNADVSQHQQREGLLTDSEDDFESSLVAARRLRPTNTTQAATWHAATSQSKADQVPATFSAHCTVNIASASQAAAFSTIFRQTPTDLTAVEAEEGSQFWEEEYSRDGQSEYSGGLSEEPSAAHWAELQDNPSQVVSY